MASWPYLTSELPGCGGAFKLAPEDFEVEEVPAYEPLGEGEHLFLWMEKRGLSTPEAVRRLSRHLELDVEQVGSAGLKDAQAVTRQWLSVPVAAAPRLPSFEDPAIRILEARRHRNKLRTGHLRANRFRLRLRQVRDFGLLQELVSLLVARGVPNYFGEQRFGRRGDNAELGRRLLLGERLESPPSRFERRLFLSAFQSELFNQALAARLSAGTFSQALPGDVLMRHDSGGAFVCADPAVDQPRVERFEVSPAGPLFGPKLLAAEKEVASAEQALLARAQVSLEDFARGRGETQGARRSYRVRLEGLTCEQEGGDAWLRFALPPGSYATVVLRELLKAEPPAALTPAR